MERDIRKRMSQEQPPDRMDSEIMRLLVTARHRSKNRREYLERRKAIIGSFDLVTVKRNQG